MNRKQKLNPSVAIVLDIDRTVIDTSKIVLKMGQATLDLGLVHDLVDFVILYEISRRQNGNPDYQLIASQLAENNSSFSANHVEMALADARSDFSKLLYEGAREFINRNWQNPNIWQVAFTQGREREQRNKLVHNGIDQMFDETVIRENKRDFCFQFIGQLINRGIVNIFVADDNQSILDEFNSALARLKEQDGEKYGEVKLETVLVGHDKPEGNCHSIQDIEGSFYHFCHFNGINIESDLPPVSRA